MLNKRFGVIAKASPMILGYARVSTRDQTVALQVDALRAAGCAKVLTEVASGAI
ncbi:recombinase family protein [Undibacterium arcticum]